MSGIVRWEQPPSLPALRAAEKAARWQSIADGLRARPGEWAVIKEGSINGLTNDVTYIRKGTGPFAPAGAFEALQRTDPNDPGARGRTGKVYARYIGSPEPS